MAYGYWGKILIVDLSTGEIKEEHPGEEVYKHYLGGYGLGVYHLYQHIPKMADPLGPDNILGIIPGLLTGSGAQFSGRFMVVARSPLTSAWADANCGGDFGVALRGAGWDGLFIRGISQHPVYLYIIGEQVKICDASPLWGLDAVETEHAIQQALGKDVRVACIGPAGEHLSLISGIVNDEGRLAARGGLGAVMGSKRLKAIAARGNRRPPQASPHSFKAVTTPYLQIFKQPTSRWISRVPGILTRLLPFMRRLRVRLSSAPGKLVIDSFRRYGTAAGTSALIELGDTPVRNWSGIGYRDFPIDEAEKLSGEAVIRPAVRAYACHSCPVACGAIVRINDQQSGHKPEYESLAAFGPLLMVSDLESVMHCNHLCNNAGLDVISTGVAIAFALECAENGWLPDELANELPLGWGDGQVIAELIERIIRRQAGLGD